MGFFNAFKSLLLDMLIKKSIIINTQLILIAALPIIIEMGNRNIAQSKKKILLL